MLLSASFPSQACEPRRNTKRLSTYIIKDDVFDIACACNSFKAKSMLQAWRKLWPTVMAGEGASDEKDFAGFNIRDKDNSWNGVVWKAECEVSQIDVEVWTDASKGTAVSRTVADVDSIMLFWAQTLRVKFLITNLQTKKSPKKKILGLKLPTRILRFWRLPKACHFTRTWHRKLGSCIFCIPLFCRIEKKAPSKQTFARCSDNL